MLAKKKKQ